MAKRSSYSRHIAVVANERGLGSAELKAEFEKLGQKVTFHNDGDPAMLDADVIFINTVRNISKTRILLRGMEKRPVTLIRVHDPILPSDISTLGENFGNGLTTVFRGMKQNNRLYLWIVRVLYWPISLFCMGRWSGSLMPKDVQSLFEYTAWLRSGLTEGWIDMVALSTVQKCNTIQNWGYKAILLPHSYEWKPDQLVSISKERDIDVLFLGRLSGLHRIFSLLRIMWRLRRKGFRVAAHFYGLRGEKRNSVLARTKVILHLSKYPFDTPWMRWYVGATYGVAIASEPVYISTPFRPEVDYLTGSIKELPDKIANLLKDEKARNALVCNCRKRIEENMTMRAGIERILDEASKLRK